NLKQIAKGIAAQCGSNCEVVIHELSDQSAYHSIVAIENGHVTGRKIGDGPSHVVLEQLGKPRDDTPDELCYLTRTPDGKILKSSSMYIRDSERSEEHTSELQSRFDLVCRLLLEKKKIQKQDNIRNQSKEVYNV